MDDFLYNLRKSVEERSKSGNSQRGGDRRCGVDRRNRKPQKHQSDRRSSPPYNRNLHEIRVLLERFVEGQGQQQALEEKRLELETRRTEAMERIAKSLSRMSNAPVEAEVSTDAPKAAPAQSRKKPAPQTAGPATAEQVMTQLRAEGMSYERIAQALEAKGFATVSGRGRWRGQTVKRSLLKLGVQN
jgi:hypothetical protein